MLNVEPITILIVDDNDKNLFTLRSLITEHLEAYVIEAQSGEAALKILLKQKINLIVLDVQMPEMDGFETAQLISSHRKTRHIPIVFLTAAYKTDEFVQRGFSLGAVDYLTKPIDASQLLNKIRSYMRFIAQERQHKQELEKRIEERTIKLSEANKQLKQEVIERKQIEKELSRAKEIAEEANRAKSYFLANMSHELRTPLNAIIGYSEMLEEFAEEIAQEDFIPDLRRIHAAGRHLLELINDVLDLSKIEAGKMSLFLETFELESFINDIADTVQPLLEKKSNNLQIEYFCELKKIHNDRTRLRQMLLNLISNATKFSEQSVILLQISCDIFNGEKRISFCVTDDGIGITEEQQKKLFQPFTQAEASTTRRFGGTGLGLTITRQFAEMLGGSVNIVSEFGYGSTFSLRLPIQVKEPVTTDETVEEITTITDSILLIIDNDKAQRDLLKDQLKQFGYSIALANNDEESIKVAKKLRPDLIILSIQTPVGWELLAHLKNDAFLSRIPVILITRDATKGYASYALDCIVKPLRHEQLTVILDRYTLDTPAIMMIVDDNEEVQYTITALFKKKDWQVVSVANSLQALEQLTHLQPHLLFIDLANNVESIKRLQMNNLLENTHFITMSTQHLTAEDCAYLNQHTESASHKKGYLLTEFPTHLHTLITLYLSK
jgi:signal transduction histidine kinase